MKTPTGDDYANVPVTKAEATEGSPINLEPLLQMMQEHVRRRASKLRLIAPPDPDQEQPQQPAPKKQPRTKPIARKPRNRSPRK